MCREVLRIVQDMDLKSVEFQLALQCAPVITGIKISNLLIISKNDEEALRVILRKSGITYFRLCQNGEKLTYLLFHRMPLNFYLENNDIKNFLRKCGYEELALGKVLKTFQERYLAYMKQGAEFPHEMGVLLGYPLEDVVGFMQDSGDEYLYAGYWKVYSNVEEKIEIFKSYEDAQTKLVGLLSKGEDLRNYFKTYLEAEADMKLVS